jgi:RNA polymerase sigma-70 factor, ECF subfamily
MRVKPAACSSEAAGQLVEAFRPSAIALATSILGNKEDAEDACQEMCVSALANITLQSTLNIKGWLTRILINKCMDVLRNRKRSRGLFQRIRANDARLSFFPGNPVEKGSAKERIVSTDGMFRSLSRSERIAISLWANEDYSPDEIAELMNCSPSTVRVYLFKARRKIKKNMERHNATM